MEKKIIESKKKNNLYFIGSARGVNRFYITNKMIEINPNSKVINTGALLQSLTKTLNLKDFENLTIKEYYQIVEPLLVEMIINHLEYNDVILDTHFHYMIPCLSTESLLKFKGKTGQVFLILVDENPETVFKRNSCSEDLWFKNIQNMKNDLIMNKYYFNFYKEIFEGFTDVKTLIIDVSNNNDIINNLLEKLKSEKFT